MLPKPTLCAYRNMLTELKETRQIDGEPVRRWFMSPSMDLIVWHDERMNIVGFQLCYDKCLHERAITWHIGGQPVHSAIQSGESRGLKYKESPILLEDGKPDLSYIARCFEEQSGKLPADIIALVLSTLAMHK